MAARDETKKKSRLWLHLLLFLATCGSTFFAGAVFFGTEQNWFLPQAGVVFAVSIMTILSVHEFGHFFAARAHGVDVSLPFFLPAPFPPVGTFGAVIRMREPPRTRGGLLDIGVAGPLAGLVVTLLVGIIGLRLSEVQPLSAVSGDSFLEGNSLLYLLMKKLAHPEMGSGDDVRLHPMAWAGWLGLLVTSLNLLPAGQLDGGHIVYALWGKKVHEKTSTWVQVILFSAGMVGLACQLVLLDNSMVRSLDESGALPWVLRGTGMLVGLVWTVLLKFVGGRHPEVEGMDVPLTKGRRILGLISLAVLVLAFTPSVLSPVAP
jgi:membrane-associated protease RseP (regulator of RpoE activity)